MTIVYGAYLAALLLAAVIATLMRQSQTGILLGTAALITGALWLWVGEHAAHTSLVLALVLVVFTVTTYAFRTLLLLLLPAKLRSEFRMAPPTAMFGLMIISLYAACAILAPFIAPHSQSEIVSTSFAPPSADLILGADQLGRDIFSRVIYGARNSVGIALFATLIAFVAGAITGLIAAMRGGIVDQLLGRLADVLMSVPSLIFSLLMLSIFGTEIYVIVLVVATIYMPRVFRLTRAVAGEIVVTDYIESARLRSEGSWYMIRREILPNAMAPLIAEFGLEFCFVFLLIAGLSFLGVGVQPPTADWGSMVRENATLISFGDFTPLIPAGAIALLAVAVNFVIDWMLYRSSGLKEK